MRTNAKAVRKATSRWREAPRNLQCWQHSMQSVVFGSDPWGCYWSVGVLDVLVSNASDTCVRHIWQGAQPIVPCMNASSWDNLYTEYVSLYCSCMYEIFFEESEHLNFCRVKTWNDRSVLYGEWICKCSASCNVGSAGDCCLCSFMDTNKSLQCLVRCFVKGEKESRKA